VVADGRRGRLDGAGGLRDFRQRWLVHDIRVFIGVKPAHLESPYRAEAIERGDSYYVTAHLNSHVGRYEARIMTGGISGERTSIAWVRRDEYGGDEHKIFRCAGITAAFDYQREEVRFIIGRGCLNDPKWIAVDVDFELHHYFRCP